MNGLGKKSMNGIRENEVPKLRTINKAVEMIKASDPECQITTCMVRKAIKNGDFKARRVGSKYLVDVDKLVEFFRCIEPEESSA